MSSAYREPGPLVAVDLFCGIGGKTHGFIKAGIDVVAGVDSDSTCQYGFEANNNGAKFHHLSVDELTGEVLNSWYPPGSTRVLIGCAPCQPFSTYSYRYQEQDGRRREDQRWGLLLAFGKLIKQTLPEIVTAENVPELQSRGTVFDEFIALLKGLDYSPSVAVVKCSDYGVPQTRERLVVLASRLGPIGLIEPKPRRLVTVRDKIGGLPQITAGGPAPADDPLHRSSGLSPLNLRRIQATPAGGGWHDWPNELRLACHKKESGKTYPSVYGRMPWDGLAPTITLPPWWMAGMR